MEPKSNHPQKSLRRALFLDRDGVINRDDGYVGHKDQFHFMPGIVEALKAAKDQGLLLIVVTNQSGIARGLFTEEDYQTLTKWWRWELARQGVLIDAVYHCPFHPEGTVAAYAKDNDWRKPKPGMLLKAASDLGIDLSRSLMLGDSARDMEAGYAAGLKANILLSKDDNGIRSDFRLSSLEEFPKLLIDIMKNA